MSKRFRQKISNQFKVKYCCFKRCNLLARLLCCCSKNLNEFKLAMEYYDQVLQQAKYCMSIRRMTGIEHAKDNKEQANTIVSKLRRKFKKLGTLSLNPSSEKSMRETSKDPQNATPPSQSFTVPTPN